MLKIMSFNTQHCKNFKTKKIDYKSIINLIKVNNIDIIGLNEIFSLNKSISQSNIIAKKLNYYHIFGKATNIILPYGNAIISKYPIESYEIINIPLPKNKTFKNHYEKRSILKAKILINNTYLNVYITHLGLNTDEQINGIKTLVDNVIKDNSIIMGDFNMTPDNKLLNSLNNFNTRTIEKTWPSDKPIKKLDYIYVSKNIKIKSSKVLNDIISDHKPIIAEIEVK